MKPSVEKILFELLERYPQLSACEQAIKEAYLLLENCYEQDGKVLICGNGGSAADSDHIVGELMKGFTKKRPIDSESRRKLAESWGENEGYSLADRLQGALPAISLMQHSALVSAFSNDVDPDMIFAQQAFGYGRPGDVLIGMSTSGNSKNVVNAVKVANAMGLKTIGLTGENGGKLSLLCSAAICVPELETFKIQELHLPVYHALCAMIEETFFTL